MPIPYRATLPLVLLLLLRCSGQSVDTGPHLATIDARVILDAGSHGVAGNGKTLGSEDDAETPPADAPADAAAAGDVSDALSAEIEDGDAVAETDVPPDVDDAGDADPGSVVHDVDVPDTIEDVDSSEADVVDPKDADGLSDPGGDAVDGRADASDASDTSETADADVEGHEGTVSDRPDTLSCPLSFEECLHPYPGCWMGACDELEACPISGCDTDGPPLRHLLWGGDGCGGRWVVLVDEDDRLRATAAANAGMDAATFGVLLDDRPTGVTCSLFGLPTGAIRYQLDCRDGDSNLVYAAVMEIGGPEPCPGCPDRSGCFLARSDDLLPLPGVGQGLWLQVDGLRPPSCFVRARTEAEPAPDLTGMLRHDGVLTLWTSQGTTTGAVCSFVPDGSGYEGAVCIQSGSTETEYYEVDVLRAVDRECPLPQCISADTCVLLSRGDACEEGVCTCEGNPACAAGTVCAPDRDQPGGCGPEELAAGPRACREDADCRMCFGDTPPVCCDQAFDGSAFDAVNVLHDCPSCCTCSQSCVGIEWPAGVGCEAGRCTYRFD